MAVQSTVGRFIELKFDTRSVLVDLGTLEQISKDGEELVLRYSSGNHTTLGYTEEVEAAAIYRTLWMLLAEYHNSVADPTPRA